jgi:hypothetical protein
MKRVLAVACTSLFLAGCGSSSGIKNFFTEEVITLRTVYVQGQDLELTGTPASYPATWTTSPDPSTVVKPSVSALTGTTTETLGQTLEDGSQAKPFNESTLQWNSINQPTNAAVFSDPSAYVLSQSGELYNLTWGSLDGNGPGYAANYGVAAIAPYQVTAPLTIWGKEVSGSVTTEGPQWLSPGHDLLEAWRQGWTGMNTRILVIDDLVDTHGTIVAGIAAQFAPGASVLGKDWDIASANSIFDSNAPLLLDGSDSGLTGTNKVHAVNLSISFGTTSLINGTIASSLKDLTGFRYTGVQLADAVVAVAAGNDAVEVTAASQPLAVTLLTDAAIQGRTLVVGALDVNLATGSKSIAGYSNRPGADASTQNRFLVASGHANWTDGYFAIDGTQEAYAANVGTSYAAPRVAAIAAIVRQKFPNLSGEQTASILLNTASYETLSCNPSCSASIYGKGEVSLRRALAPVGRLQ